MAKLGYKNGKLTSKNGKLVPCCGCGPGEKCGVTCVNGGGEYLIRILGTDHSFDAFPYTSAWVDASSIVNPAGQYRTVGGFGAQTVELQVTVTSASATPTVRLRAAYVTSAGGTTTVGPHTFTTTALTRVVSGNAREFYWLAVGSGATPAGLSIRSGLTEAYIAGFHRVSKNAHPLTVSITRGGYDPNVVSATSSLSALTALRLPSFSGSVNASTAFTFAGGENSLTSFVDPASFSVTTTDIPALDATWNPDPITFNIYPDTLGDRAQVDPYYYLIYENPVTGELIDCYISQIDNLIMPYGTGSTSADFTFNWFGSLGSSGSFTKSISTPSAYKVNNPLVIEYERFSTPYRYTPISVIYNGVPNSMGSVSFSQSFAGPVQTLTLSFRATPGGTVLGTAVIATSIVEEAANSKVCAQLGSGYNYGGKFCGRRVSQAVFSPHGLSHKASPGGVSDPAVGVNTIYFMNGSSTPNTGLFKFCSVPVIDPNTGAWSAVGTGYDGKTYAVSGSSWTDIGVLSTTTQNGTPVVIHSFLHGAVDGDELLLSTHDRPQASAPSFIAASNTILLHSFHNTNGIPAISQVVGGYTLYSTAITAWGNGLPRSPFALGICRNEEDVNIPEVSSVPVTYHLATGFTLGNVPFSSVGFDAFIYDGASAWPNVSASAPLDPHANFNGRTITAKSGGNTCTLTFSVT